MSRGSDNSEPISPTRTSSMRVDIDSLKVDVAEMKESMGELTKLLRLQLNQTQPMPSPNFASTSQYYIPQTPQPTYTQPYVSVSQGIPTSLPNPPPPPRHQTPSPYIPPYHPPPPPIARVHVVEDDEEDRVSLSHVSEAGSGERRVRPKGDKDDDDRGLRIDLPEFDGDLNPDKYLEWVCSIERIFDYKGFSDGKKFRVAILKFTGYASLWWRNVKRQREREDKEPVVKWTKLKKVMDKKFLPKTYKQELYERLHGLKQYKKTVAEYIREFDELKMKCDIPEAKEHTVAKFIGG